MVTNRTRAGQGQGKVAIAPSAGTTGHVAAAPSGGDAGHVAAAPRGPAAQHVAIGQRSAVPASDIIIPTGVSTDAGNILTLGSDSKPFLSCTEVEDCLTGLYELAGTMTAHLAEANPHPQYLLAAGPIVGRTFTF
jgi:hypothetical protein